MPTALDRFWELVWGALNLDPEAFEAVNTLPSGTTVAILVVLLAGLSQTLGQCVVLFVNRIKPFRFVLSVAIAAVLFAASYGGWALSTWLVANLLLAERLAFADVAATLALSYAPQLLGVAVGLPYLGVPIGILLSLWTLLGTITALKVISSLGTWWAFACGGAGWLVLQLLQRTVGRPIAAFGRWLTDWAAGTQLVTDPRELEQLVLAGPPMPSDLDRAVEFVRAQQRSKPLRFDPWKLFLVLAVTVFALTLLLSPSSQTWLASTYNALDRTVKLAIDLGTIFILGLLVSILLTPLEALTWWAGWYGREPLKSGTAVEKPSPRTDIARYVLYLDGINQGTYEYLPEVERLLDDLTEALPSNVLLVKGIISYSVTNRPIGEGSLFSLWWRVVESLTQRNPANPIGFVVNARNIVAVAVSADPRYGPIQNQGVAQVLFESLLRYGYPIGSRTPITLIGYSGGGQMSMGAVSFLKQATQAPIEVISLAGVISGNTGAMTVERLYHLAGEKDFVEKLGAAIFPGRWPLAFLSNWNRAKRRGRIAFVSLGEVGHNGETGPMGTRAKLADDRTHLEQTIAIVTGILLKDWTRSGLNPDDFRTVSNYERYCQAAFNRPDFHPVNVAVPGDRYRTIAPWVGRLILPDRDRRLSGGGVWLEVHCAPPEFAYLVGRTIALHWREEDETVRSYVQRVTETVRFIDRTRVSQRQGNVHPTRLDGWTAVGPLESLAGSHPDDDVLVGLSEAIVVEETDGEVRLKIDRDPVRVSGRYYGLVQFVESGESSSGDRVMVRHYNRDSGTFDGVEEVVCVPAVVDDRRGVFPSSNRGLDCSRVNEDGWYIYGAPEVTGTFVVTAIAPRRLFALPGDRVVSGEDATLEFIDREYWQDASELKGRVRTVNLLPTEKALTWQEGDRALVMHLYGGIGGKTPDFAPMGIYFGHFAYGVAQVVREPLTDELRFDIEYHQIYTHNPDGLIAGRVAWNCYAGDRQWGWLGCRPICDTLVKFPALTEDYDFDGMRFSPFDRLVRELDVMGARYRIGDGTGNTFVSAVNSCVQDSSQALYVALERTVAEIKLNPNIVKWLRDRPESPQTQRFCQLATFVATLETELAPLGKVRPDWKYGRSSLGQYPEETPLKSLANVLASWRTLLPRLAHDRMALIFLQLGASLRVQQSFQVGGFDPDIEPLAPTDFQHRIPKLIEPEGLFKTGDR
ncbi:hypothetical protein CKA32_003997 [Geitlerinema sp. FC II]|nr:hypothetical protein CKA32_003997 [Geitlerinema sp. FC II]